jgi:ATP-dependent RNA helicase DeaD
MEFDRFLKYYENAEDLNHRDKGRREQSDAPDQARRRDGRDRDGGRGRDGGRERDGGRGDNRKEFARGGGYSRLFVNLGTKDGFYKASFLQYILDMSDLKKDALGRIDMKDMNSWIEIEKGAAKQMVNALDGKSYNGRRIRMNDADSGGERRPRKGE